MAAPAAKGRRHVVGLPGGQFGLAQGRPTTLPRRATAKALETPAGQLRGQGLPSAIPMQPLDPQELCASPRAAKWRSCCRGSCCPRRGKAMPGLPRAAACRGGGRPMPGPLTPGARCAPYRSRCAAGRSGCWGRTSAPPDRLAWPPCGSINVVGVRGAASARRNESFGTSRAAQPRAAAKQLFADQGHHGD